MFGWSRLITASVPGCRLSAFHGWRAASKRPVGTTGVEKATDPVMTGAHNPVRKPFDPFTQIIFGPGRYVPRA